jgi:hypothetical protein
VIDVDDIRSRWEQVEKFLDERGAFQARQCGVRMAWVWRISLRNARRCSSTSSICSKTPSTTSTARASLSDKKALFGMVYAAVTRPYAFKDKTAARNYLTKLTGLYKNLNYAADGSNDFQRIAKAMRSLTDPSRASRPPRTATLPLWARWWRPLERKRELAERSARRGLRCR